MVAAAGHAMQVRSIRHDPLPLLTVLRRLSLSLLRLFQQPVLLVHQGMRIGHQGNPGYWAVYA